MAAPPSSNIPTTTLPDDNIPGTYTLHSLISSLPLDAGARITFVDAWSSNLYIGTSTGQVLHYVSIPPDPSDPGSQAQYIFATRLEPPYTTAQEGRDAGVKQILVLPDAGKACILCNGTLTFYTLPELSPAYGEKIKQAGCTWIGGLDANLIGDRGQGEADSSVVVICLKQRLRVIRIGREARKIRDIELGGVGAISRRADLACVAEGGKYSLLDVVNHRKHELFPISALSSGGQEEEKELPPLPVRGHAQSRSVSAASPSREPRGHDRNVSVGGAPRDSSHLRPDAASPWPSRSSSRQVGLPGEPSSREASPAKSDVASPRVSTELQGRPEKATLRPLPANIVTPTPNEFMLTTGTTLEEPGIGMFVNLDGDPSRGPLEFSSYPESLVLDGPGQNDAFGSSDTDAEGYVLAVVQRKIGEGMRRAIEVQRWDVDPGEQRHSKEWLMLESPGGEDDAEGCFGLRVATTTSELSVPEISTSLRLRCLQLSDEGKDADTKREAEEDAFAARFAQIQARVLFYTPDKVQWLTRNPLIVQLDQRLAVAIEKNDAGELSIDIGYVQHVLNDLRGQEARDELEFRTLTYIRQKASILLFGHLLLQSVNGVIAYESGKRLAEEALVSGELDPRIVLSLVPPLQQEVEEGKEGIWIPQGLRDTITMLRDSFQPGTLVQDSKGAYGDNLLSILKRYLMSWRKKKGFGSVADETHVFRTVDAALLYILLLQDEHSPRGPATPGSVRAEINDLVDRGVDCFDRAVALFEHFRRLYLLSRLYQSRKMVAEVLATWRRILDGEPDAGGELIEGEQDLRRYLAKIRDPALVQEYGAWLANRNPKLGVQIFADDSSRVKFEPAEAVEILKEKAPGAVKDYLEHLVFGKNHVRYVNDLIAFYLDTVLTALSSPEVKQSLLDSYSTYRALHPPKPTYRHFITDNATSEEWQHNRLRLLQLIGGSHGAASEYDVHALRERLAPYSEVLVPEMIILNGREGKHEEALHLLVHGLGDYDTAVRYCLLGGSSIFHPTSSLGGVERGELPSKEEQARLFNFLLHEFFAISDVSERLERTAELLERFGGWFDVGEVLALIPADWSVEVVSGFLVQGFRRMVVERHESEVVRALAGAQNLRRSGEVVDLGEKYGATVELSHGTQPQPCLATKGESQVDLSYRISIIIHIATYGPSPRHRLMAMEVAADRPNESFQYPALGAGIKQIRLLKFLGYDSDGKLGFSLECHNLEEASYIALSYTWDRYEETEDLADGLCRPVKEKPAEGIVVDGEQFLTTSSLLEFLWTISSQQWEGRLFFVDQICINQSDEHEKARLVSIMGDVYSGASEVIAWLVPLKQLNEDASRVLRTLSKSSEAQIGFLEHPENTSWWRRKLLAIWAFALANDFVRCLYAAYWSRQWIAQEIVLAKKLTFQFAEVSLDWKVVTNLCRYSGQRLLWKTMEKQDKTASFYFGTAWGPKRYRDLQNDIRHYRDSAGEIVMHDWDDKRQLPLIESHTFDEWVQKVDDLVRQSSGRGWPY